MAENVWIHFLFFAKLLHTTLATGSFPSVTQLVQIGGAFVHSFSTIFDFSIVAYSRCRPTTTVIATHNIMIYCES